MPEFNLGTVGFTYENTGFEKTSQQITQLSDKAKEVVATFQRIQEIKKRIEQSSSTEKTLLQAQFSPAQLDRAAESLKNYDQVLAHSRRGMGAFGMATQQVGYQVGDFLVQIQSGTNFLVAFGQQATQLVGILPMFTGAFGLSTTALIGLSTGLGIAIPLVTAIGAAFLRSSENSEKAAKALDSYKSALQALQQELTKTQESFNKMSFGTEDPVVANARREMELAQQRIIEARSNQRRIGNTLAPTSEELSALRQAVIEYNNAASALNKLLEYKNAESEAQRMINGGLSVAGGLQKANTLTKQEELRAQKELLSKLTQQYQIMAKTKIEGQGLADAATKALEKYGSMRTVAAELAQLTRDAANAWLSLPNTRNPSILADQYSMYGQGQKAAKEATSASSKLMGGFSILPEDWMGTKKGLDTLETKRQNEVESLVKSLQTEKEITDQWYQDSLATLQSASDSELAVLGGRNEARIRIEQEYHDRIKQMQDVAFQQRISDASNLFGTLADIAAVGGKKSAKAVATFQAVEGTINAYGAAIKALNTPGISLPGRFAAYASVLAAGLKGVAAIRSAGQIGGSSGSVGTSTVASGGQAAAPQTVYINSLQPDALYSGQTLMNLFDAFYDENDKRGKVFVVAR